MNSLGRARILAHRAFDAVWKGGHLPGERAYARKRAYGWLSRQLGIDPIHIGELDEKQCAAVVKVCNARLGKTKREIL